VAVAGSYAYIVASGFLVIVDISDPASPFMVGFCDTPGEAYGVAVRGGYAYVAASSGGLRIIDVSDPAIPTEVGFYITYYARDVVVVANYAYVADAAYLASRTSGRGLIPALERPMPAILRVAVADESGSSLRIINVSDPANPVEVGFYDTPGAACGVVVEGSHAYVADRGGGLLILRFTPPGYQVSGTIELADGTPLPGVTVSADPEGEAITDASGVYTITGLITGTYTLTPTLSGYLFTPPTRTVSVPPDAAGQDFEARLIVPAEADFAGEPQGGLAPLTVVFTNTSTGDFDTSLWAFGDGVTSTLRHPTHTYWPPDIYTVTLTVSGPGGTDTEIKGRYVTVEYGVYLPLTTRGG
jgi:hypothetical protein